MSGKIISQRLQASLPDLKDKSRTLNFFSHLALNKSHPRVKTQVRNYNKQTMAPSTSVSEFQELLASIHARNGRVMALCGAGLSAASGLGTFRGAGGMWNRYNAVELATPEAFEADPGLVVCIFPVFKTRIVTLTSFRARRTKANVL